MLGPDAVDAGPLIGVVFWAWLDVSWAACPIGIGKLLYLRMGATWGRHRRGQATMNTTGRAGDGAAHLGLRAGGDACWAGWLFSVAW